MTDESERRLLDLLNDTSLSIDTLAAATEIAGEKDLGTRMLARVQEFVRERGGIDRTEELLEIPQFGEGRLKQLRQLAQSREFRSFLASRDELELPSVGADRVEFVRFRIEPVDLLATPLDGGKLEEFLLGDEALPSTSTLAFADAAGELTRPRPGPEGEFVSLPLWANETTDNELELGPAIPDPYSYPSAPKPSTRPVTKPAKPDETGEAGQVITGLELPGGERVTGLTRTDVPNGFVRLKGGSGVPCFELLPGFTEELVRDVSIESQEVPGIAGSIDVFFTVRGQVEFSLEGSFSGKAGLELLGNGFEAAFKAAIKGAVRIQAGLTLRLRFAVQSVTITIDRVTTVTGLGWVRTCKPPQVVRYAVLRRITRKRVQRSELRVRQILPAGAHPKTVPVYFVIPL